MGIERCLLRSMYEMIFFSQVPVNTGYEKYLRFECLRKLYKFVATSNGYSDPMRIFTYLNI